MKLNWTTFKVALAFVVIIGAIFWAANSVRPLSYSGTNLTFGVGSGAVSVTNPSSETVLVQLVAPRPFAVSSTIDDASGSSARQTGVTPSTQLFEFGLPPGTSEFALTRGTDVNFVANVDTNLEATVQQKGANEARTTIIVAVIVALGALFYASHATEHSLIRTLRGKDNSTGDTQPTPAGGQGSAPRSYGDSRAKL
jgi:preprotein translocase subunit SecE